MLRGELELRSTPALPGRILQGNPPWKLISLTVITFVFDSGWRKSGRSIHVPLQHEERVISCLCPLLDQLPSCFKLFPGIQSRQFQGPYGRETLFL